MMTQLSARADVGVVQARIAEIAASFVEERDERLQRRALDPADFARLAEAGFLLTGVPVEDGGLWQGFGGTIRTIGGMLRALAHGDPSLALVASMHPAVLWSMFWLAYPEAPEPYGQAWAEQRRWAFQTAKDGAWWGTLSSEPGSGGDGGRVKTVAAADGRGGWGLTGHKHFGSGSGIASYFLMTAKPENEPEADLFWIDVRGASWDGSSGMTLVAPWDGQGMAATQSHAFQFDGFPAMRIAWPKESRRAPAPAGAAGTLWTAVILGIVETAIETARVQLARRTSLRPFEEVEWTRAEMEGWLVEQAYEGMVRAIEADPNPVSRSRAAWQGKIACAELAESALTRLCRVMGGGSYSRRSPFGYWLEDVRALGFLRPPWAFAFDALYAGSGLPTSSFVR